MIYFSNSDDNSALYSMRTDGTELKKLSSDYSKPVKVVGDWLYYLKGRRGYKKIYKMSASGANLD
jgi:Tol biopolymer transport system component